MLRTALRSALRKVVVGEHTSSKLQLQAARVLAANLHSSGSSGKAESASPAAQTVSHFEGIKSRGFYLDDIYQHVKNTDVTDLKIVEDGKHVQITWNDGHVSRFHSMWLRHNCHCGTCLPHTSTVLVDFSKVDLDLRVTSVAKDGDDVVVFGWTGKTGEIHHEGPILTKFLRYHCYSDAEDNKRRAEKAMKFNEKKIIPEVDYKEVMHSDEGLYKWLMALNEIGLCLVKNVPTVRGAIGPITERIAPIQHTIYGDIFDVESSPKPMNAAYTGVGLDLHMDQIHYESPPGLQLLHCIEFDESIKGGENFFVDLHEVAHNFKKEYPDLCYTLSKIPSCANTVDYTREFPAHVRIQRPLITINHKDEIVSVLWQPMLIAPLQVPEKDVEPFYKAYKQFYTMIHYCDSMYENRLQPGDMISFNNRRVLHGRKAYTETGRRLLQGTYVNISEFQSKVQIFHNRYGGGRWPTRCGSIDWQ